MEGKEGKTRTRLLLIGGILILIFAVTVPKIYIVHDATDGTLLWKEEKAYLFVRVVSRGLHANFPEYLLELVRESFGGVASPDDQSVCTIVLDIGSDRVREFSKEGIEFFPQILNGDIVGGYTKNGEFQIWKWTGSEFLLATEQERRDLEQQQRANNLSGHVPALDFDDLQHWSRRSNSLTRSIDLKLTRGGAAETFTVSGEKVGGVLTVERVRSGQAPEVIWTLDTRPHNVSGSEYQRIFHEN
jgi:hypothetical protein